MCGIYLAISTITTKPLDQASSRRLCNRGPDSLGQVDTSAEPSTSTCGPTWLSFTSTVLSLRGDSVTEQPFLDADTGSVFCWNGEAWKIQGQAVFGNDGAAIFSRLAKASSPSSPAPEAAVLEVFQSIEGPFAFVYLDKPAKKIYYGRDRLGRRSLLMLRDESCDSLVITSVATATAPGWTEVEADGIYVIDLSSHSHVDGLVGPPFSTTRHDWAPDSAEGGVSVIPPR